MVINCIFCGKKLIERKSNGLFDFKFGKREGSAPVVDMQIHGSLTIKCLRRSCGRANVLNYFPDNPAKEETNQ